MERIIIICCLMFILGCDSDSSNSSLEVDETVPKTVQKIRTITSSTPQRVADLTRLAIALEKFKQANKRYPISSGQGQGFDGIFSKYGESRDEWIVGLAPEFIESLPRDPRKHSSDVEQYLYKSNGANYKLIAHGPGFEECKRVAVMYPDLIDKERDCWAYGFWTYPASGW